MDPVETPTTSSPSPSPAKIVLEKLTIVAFVVGLVGGMVGSWVWNQYGSGTSSTSRELVVQENSAIIDVAKKVAPSVVSITSTSIRDGLFGRQAVSGAGTGIVVGADGLILTNKHVVPAGTSEVLVYTDDGEEHKGKVVGRDPTNDLALVKISASKLTPIQLGDSGKVEVGQKVIAIGNALGQFQNTVTTGIISGIGRPVEAGDEFSSETLQNLLQTDAAINPGNSGGPLVDLDGKLIGINTAVAGDAENIGFSIPINEAKPVIDSYKRTGKIVRAFLGVRFIAITKEYAAANDLPVSEGAYVDPESANPVVPGSPAAKAGIKGGDIITKVNGDAVNNKNSLTSLIGKYKPGDKVTITILRNKKELKVDVTLTETPE